MTLVFLQPLLSRLADEAPGVQLHVRPLGATYRDQLRSDLVDLVIVPREVMGPSPELGTSALFEDRYVCAVGGGHPRLGDTISLEEFTELPYVAYHADPLGSVAESQLDARGVTRNHQISVQSFLVAPFLLAGTPRVSLVHERLARIVQEHLDIRVVEPPVRLDPITQVMAWSTRHDHDPGHAWLRSRLHDLASSL